MTFYPRPYQIEARDSALKLLLQGYSIVGKAGTGAGKTIIIGLILLVLLKMGGRVLFVVHNKKLVHQPLQRFRDFFPKLAEMGMGAIQGKHNDLDKRVTTATFQSLTAMVNRKYPDQGTRLDQYLYYGVPDILIHDECHRAFAKNQMKIRRKLQRLNPNLKLIGISATPDRNAKQSWDKIFDRRAFNILPYSLIGLGYLKNPIAHNFDLPVDFSNVRVSGSGKARDFVMNDEINSLIDVENIHEVTFEKWTEFGENRDTLFFTPLVNSAMNFCKYFSDQGVKCCVIAGDDKKTGRWYGENFVPIERETLLQEYEFGDIKIIFNCLVLTEGFHAPTTSCIVLCRPTRSELLLTQIVGRGLSIYGADPQFDQECLILSFVPWNAKKILTGEDFIKRPRIERDAIKKGKEEGLVIDQIMADALQGIGVDPDEVLIRQVEILDRSKYAWLITDEGSFAGIGQIKVDKRTVMHGVAVLKPEYVIDSVLPRVEAGRNFNGSLTPPAQNQLEMMEKVVGGEQSAWYYQVDAETGNPVRKPHLITTVANTPERVEQITKRAELFAQSKSNQYNSEFIKRKATWRQKPISDHEVRLMESYGMDSEGWTRDYAAKVLFYKMGMGAFR